MYATSLEKRTIAARARSLQNEAKPSEANSVSRQSQVSKRVPYDVFRQMMQKILFFRTCLEKSD